MKKPIPVKIAAFLLFAVCLDHAPGQEVTAVTISDQVMVDDCIPLGLNFVPYAKQVGSGNRIWKTKLGARSCASVSVSTASGGTSDAAVVYAGCDDGTVWALNAADGKPLWSLKVSNAKIMGDPCIEDGFVCVVDSEGYVYAISDMR